MGSMDCALGELACTHSMVRLCTWEGGIAQNADGLCTLENGTVHMGIYECTRV